MSFTFVLGEYYNVYLKEDNEKKIFKAKFEGGQDPLIFTDNNIKYNSYELVYVKSKTEEISL